MVDLFHTELSLASTIMFVTTVYFHSQMSFVFVSKGAISTDHLSKYLSIAFTS